MTRTRHAGAPVNIRLTGKQFLLSPEREGERRGLTGHRVWAGHEVQRDGVGGVGGHALQVALGDFVEAVGGGGHVFIHPVQERVHA